jgi:hypothetical protein
MLGLGVGSGVWRKLELPQEQDELVPVIFFNAPESFRPIPFMVEAWRTRTNTNNLERVMLMKLNGKCLPEVAPPSCDYSCSKELRKRGFLHLNLSTKPMENPKSKVWESEWNRGMNVRVKSSPLGLYLKSHELKQLGTRRQQRLVAVGACGAEEPFLLGRPTQGFGWPLGGPPGWQLGFTVSPTPTSFDA